MMEMQKMMMETMMKNPQSIGVTKTPGMPAEDMAKRMEEFNNLMQGMNQIINPPVKKKKAKTS